MVLNIWDKVIDMTDAQKRFLDTVSDKWKDVPSKINRRTVLALEKAGLIEVTRQRLTVETREGGFLSQNLIKTEMINFRVRLK